MLVGYLKLGLGGTGQPLQGFALGGPALLWFGGNEASAPD